MNVKMILQFVPLIYVETDRLIKIKDAMIKILNQMTAVLVYVKSSQDTHALSRHAQRPAEMEF